MKFGPEWLRNMSQDGNSSGPAPPITLPGPKYQLADYRYGREEMLALYDEQGVKFSDSILSLACDLDPMLYSVEVQTPLSFIPMTEDETRNYNRGFNSRGFSNPTLGGNVDTSGGGGNKPLNKTNTSPLLIGPSSTGRDSTFWNRFSGVERGRGRGGPGGSGYHNTRPGKDGGPNEMYNNTMNRNNRFGVNADMQSNRGWNDRNGILDPDTKKDGQGLHNRLQNLSSGSVTDSNWRRFREEEESWRPNFSRTNSAGNNAEKWGGRGSWRQQVEQNGRSAGNEQEDKWEKERINSKWDENKQSNQNHQYISPGGHHNVNNNGHHGNNNGLNRLRRYSFTEDNLPEWATENLSETRGGTFDSNGAYHGMYSDDENENTNRRKQEHQPPSNENRYYAPPQGGDNTAHPYEDSLASAPPFANSSDPPANGNPLSPPPSHPSLHQPSPMKSNELPPQHSNPQPASYKESQEKSADHLHGAAPPAASPAQNAGLEASNRVDSLDFINERLSKVVDDIDRLITEEDKEPPHNNGTTPSNGAPQNADKDKWLYKDPQGNVQGPFTSAAMAEWYRSGYFRTNLLVKRVCDEIFSPLGDLLHFFGSIPFVVDSFRPIKASDHIASQTTKPLEEALHIQQSRDAYYKRMLVTQQQQLVDAVVKNLRQLDNWGQMSVPEQNNLIMQHMNRILHTSNLGMFNQPTQAPINIPPTNPIMQLVTEMTRQEPHFPSPHGNVAAPHLSNVPSQPQHRPDTLAPSPSHMVDPPHLNHSHSDSGKPPGHLPHDHSQQQSASNNPQVPTNNNSVQMFLRQVLAAQQQQQQPPSPMSQMIPPPNVNLPSAAQMPVNPHQTMQPNNVWGIPGEKVDFMRLDANNYFPQQLGAAPELNNAKGQFDQLMRMLIRNDIDSKNTSPSHSPPAQHPPHIQEKQATSVPLAASELTVTKPDSVPPPKSSAEEKKKKKQQQQEEKERDESERKQRAKEEALLKQQDDERRKEEEKRKKTEEQKKKKEEKERLKKQEEEKKKKAEEERLVEEQKQKEKEEKRKLEQQRQEEALRKLEQQQLKEKSTNKTWNSSVFSTPQPTLADIQKLEKEQKQQQMKQQQQQQQQQTKKQQKAVQQQQPGNETPKTNKKSDKTKETASLKLGWASQKPVPVKTKTLAEIQAEQTEQLAKQLEKEKQERLANPQKVEVVRSKTQFWGTSASMSTPTNYAQASAKPVISTKVNNVKQTVLSNNVSSGFWDEPVKILSNPVNLSKNNKNTNSSKTSNIVGGSSNASNNKAKKEEIKIKEIFTSSVLKESSGSEVKFINWCTSSLASMKIHDLDIPTFIGFLKEIESPQEVKDYVKLYIGEGKQANNFANQYLEKRQACNEPDYLSSTNSAMKQSKSKSTSDVPKKTTEFVEVKGKSKKKQKGKMRHIDTTLLGFSVTAPPDRFNVGERELPDV